MSEAEHRCILCGSGRRVALWTLNKAAGGVGVTYLCEEHGTPLEEVLEAAGGLPPSEQVPVPEREAEAPVEVEPAPKGSRSRAKPRVEALAWTPPS